MMRADCYQARKDIFAKAIEKPEQLYGHVVEIAERVRADGYVEEKPDGRRYALG